MSRQWKLTFWIGIPIVVIIIIVGTLIGMSRESGSALVTQYGGYGVASDGYYAQDFDLAVAEEPGMVDDLKAKLLRTSGGVEESMPNVQPGAPQASNNVSTGERQQAQERLIIKTGNISMVVENVRAGIKAISEYAVEKGGFVVSSNIDKIGLSLSGYITFRIPVEIFDQAQEDVKNMGEVTSESMNGQDVTEEYVDLDSQLKNLRATEEQFLEIMKKATEIEDILAVQNQLTIVRGNIEGIEGRMKYLRESASMSTLTIYLSTDPDVLPAWDEEDQWKPWGVVKEAVRSLADMGKGLVNLLIWLVVYIPLWLLILAVVWIVIRVAKRIRRRKLEIK